MKILIDVPPVLHYGLVWTGYFIGQLTSGWNHMYTYVSEGSSDLYELVRNQIEQRNASYVVPITALLLVFWPLLVTMIMAFATAWTWIFWLSTSMIFGVLQLGYVSYQFGMIAGDIMGLSALKTYSVCRRQLILGIEYLVECLTSSNKFNGWFVEEHIIRPMGIGKSKRRVWKQRLEDAGNYEDFLKIRIENKDCSEILDQISAKLDTRLRRRPSDTALPPLLQGGEQVKDRHQQQYHTKKSRNKLLKSGNIPRVHSFNNHVDEYEHIQNAAATPPPTTTAGRVIPRNRSFSNSSDTAASAGQLASSPFASGSGPRSLFSAVDPVVAEELGERTADLLVTTTARIREARLAAIAATSAPSSANASPRNSPSRNNNSNNSNNSNNNGTSSQPESPDYNTRNGSASNASPDRSTGVFSSSSAVTAANTATQTLVYLLSGVLKRNHLKLDDCVVENARKIAWNGQYGYTSATRQTIRAYYDEVTKSLEFIAESNILISGEGEIDTTPSHRNNTKPTTTRIRPNGGSNQSRGSSSSSSVGDNPNGDHDKDAAVPDIEEATNNNDGGNRSNSQQINTALFEQQSQLLERITLVRRMKQNMGRTALMLSGGGAIAMYHLGVVRALIESRIYDDIKVISGTSGGSISAAMCAIKTAEEMHREVCVPWISTDYRLDGRMRRENIRWFPTIWEMATYWVQNKHLVASSEFRRTCEFYYSDITFEEAFIRTGKHVCINVSASRASGDTAQRLLLNHISTPHVTIASAVAASCALPGVMKPTKLMAKNHVTGELEPFEVDGVEWIDGSVQADLPFQRISTLFAVSSFIVSQVNFHVHPLMYKAHHPNQNSAYWKLFQMMEWDIRNRALKLSRLGLFPKFFGQDVSKIFKQKYHGNLTIVPRFTTMQTFGLKALSNPTVEDMEDYLKYGQIATWPYLNAIRDMIRLEKALEDCLTRLEERVREIAPEISGDWSAMGGGHDDIDSISVASSSAYNSGHHGGGGGGGGNSSANGGGTSSRAVRIVGRPPLGIGVSRDRDSERLRKQMHHLEHENYALRQQLEQLQNQLRSNGPPNTARLVHEEQSDEEREPKTKKEDGVQSTTIAQRVDSNNTPSVAVGSEGGVWRLVRKGSQER